MVILVQSGDIFQNSQSLCQQSRQITSSPYVFDNLFTFTLHSIFRNILNKVNQTNGAKDIVSKLKPEMGHISIEILSGSETRHIYILCTSHPEHTISFLVSPFFESENLNSGLLAFSINFGSFQINMHLNQIPKIKFLWLCLCFLECYQYGHLIDFIKTAQTRTNLIHLN